MNTEQTLQRAEALLQPIANEIKRPAPERLDAYLAVGKLTAAVHALRQARFGYLSAVSGLDLPPVPAKGEAPEQPGRIEVLYHVCEGAAVVTLRVTVPYADARVPSICGIMPAATLYERELSEMFGVTVEGTPDPSRLLLPDEWPADVYPLRKSYVAKSEAAPTA